MSETPLNEIRATKPAAPPALRERVRAIAAQKPAREPFLARLRWRQLVLAVPATAVVALVAAGVIGLSDSSSDQTAASGSVPTTALETLAPQREIQRGLRAKPAPPASATAGGAATTPAFDWATAPKHEALQPQVIQPQVTGNAADSTGDAIGPAPGQLQRYEAELRLRVDDVEALSNATKRAQRIVVQHSGSVASLQYDAPAEGVGAAQITLRVPTARVQSAMAQLAALGTIVGQRYGIDDLQQQADSLQTQIEQAQRQIAQLRARLESTTLSDETRAVLEGRLTNARQKLTSLRQARSGTIAEARTATIYLSLTTEEIEPAVVGGGSRLDDVKDVLAWEAIALLYFLVVAGPFILLGLLIWLALRLRRRQVETRLLEQN